MKIENSYFTRKNTWANFNNKNELYLYSTSNKWNIPEKKVFLFCPRPIMITFVFVYGSPFTFLVNNSNNRRFHSNMKQFFLRGNMGAFFLTNMAIWVQFFLTNAIWVQRICYFLVFFPWLDISNASQLARPVSQFCLGYFLPIS